MCLEMQNLARACRVRFPNLFTNVDVIIISIEIIVQHWYTNIINNIVIIFFFNNIQYSSSFVVNIFPNGDD